MDEIDLQRAVSRTQCSGIPAIPLIFEQLEVKCSCLDRVNPTTLPRELLLSSDNHPLASWAKYTNVED
jgi:hypothetical protein